MILEIILSRKTRIFINWLIWTISFAILLPAFFETFLLLFLGSRIFHFTMNFSTINLYFLIIISIYTFLLPRAEGKYNKIALTLFFSTMLIVFSFIIEKFESTNIYILNKPSAEHTILFYLSGLIVPSLLIFSKKIMPKPIPESEEIVQNELIFINENKHTEKETLRKWKFVSGLIISSLFIVYLALIYLTATVPSFDLMLKKCSTDADCPAPPNDLPNWKSASSCENNKCILIHTQINP